MISSGGYMKKINDELKKIIANIDGKILCIGIYDENLLKSISKNNKIIDCDILTGKSNNNTGGKGKSKKINIKNIRKKFKNVDYIIGNMEELIEFKKTFVKDSIYMNKNHLYLFFDKNISYQEISKMYNRYQVSINKINCQDGIILDINTVEAKGNKIKDFYYLIYDTLIDIYNLIGEFLGS